MVVKKTKGISKKILCIALVVMLMAALAIPSFAAERQVRSSSPVGAGRVTLNGHGRSDSNGGCLNIVGSGGAYDGQTVNLWEHTTSLDQKWTIENSYVNSGAYIYQSQTAGGVRLAVNLWRTAVSPGVYPVKLAPTLNNSDDTNLTIFDKGGNVFKAWLKGGPYVGYTLYIDHSDSSVKNSDVYFFNSLKDTNTQWYWYNS